MYFRNAGALPNCTKEFGPEFGSCMPRFGTNVLVRLIVQGRSGARRERRSVRGAGRVSDAVRKDWKSPGRRLRAIDVPYRRRDCALTPGYALAGNREA